MGTEKLLCETPGHKERQINESCQSVSQLLSRVPRCNPMGACQAPLFMGFSWQENWSRLPFPPPGDLDSGSSCLLHWQVDSFPLSHVGSSGAKSYRWAPRSELRCSDSRSEQHTLHQYKYPWRVCCNSPSSSPNQIPSNPEDPASGTKSQRIGRHPKHLVESQYHQEQAHPPPQSSSSCWGIQAHPHKTIHTWSRHTPTKTIHTGSRHTPQNYPQATHGPEPTWQGLHVTTKPLDVSGPFLKWHSWTSLVVQ